MLLERYTHITCVNLVNKTGEEGKLAQEYKKIVKEVNYDKIKYYDFDFHKECKNMDMTNIEKFLTDTLKNYGDE
jgi:phosphatidylinositol 4-phosphatase